MASEDVVTAEQTGEEGVVLCLLAGRPRMAHNQNSGLVYEGKGCEIAGMYTGSFEDNAELFTESVLQELTSINPLRSSRKGQGRLTFQTGRERPY